MSRNEFISLDYVTIDKYIKLMSYVKEEEEKANKN